MDAVPVAQEVCYPPGQAAVLDAAAAADVAELLKAIADPVRLRLLMHIAGAPGTTVCACHLPQPLGISQPTLSHHLKKLMEAGLITRERRGRWAHYTLVAERLEEAVAPLAGMASPGSSVSPTAQIPGEPAGCGQT